METVINPDQTGFIRGRYIGENIVIRTVLDLGETCSKQHIEGQLMSCDMHKAYDSVNGKYEVVRKVGFGENFRKWINILYTNTTEQAPTARVQLNRCLSSAYVIERGLRHGCPLNCYLFLLCIEPLLRRIKSTPRVKVIQVYENS